MAKFCPFCKNHFDNVDQCPFDGTALTNDELDLGEMSLNDQLTNLIVDEAHSNNKRKMFSRSGSINSFTSVSGL
jgi:hypothetical protein